MKLLLMLMTGIVAHAGNAQNTDTEENYKHLHNSKHKQQLQTHTDLAEDSVTLNNQRTHKKTSRTYIIAPCDCTPGTNVQGKKTKKNYKNQFN